MYPKNQFPNTCLGIDNIMGIHIYIYQNGNKKICDAQMGVGNRLRLSIPWTAGAMILKYNDLYIYIHQSKMETKKYAEHKRRAQIYATVASICAA